MTALGAQKASPPTSLLYPLIVGTSWKVGASDARRLVSENDEYHTRGKTESTVVSIFQSSTLRLTVWESIQNASQKLLRDLADKLGVVIFCALAAMAGF